MNIGVSEDVAAPIAYVFDQLSDFSRFERAVLRRGADVSRLDNLGAPGAGMAWDTAFDLRGRRREVRLELTGFDPPNGMVFDTCSQSLRGGLTVDLVALSRARTRISLAVEMRPLTLSARLLVQSLRLARNSVTKRVRAGLDTVARDIEERYAARA